jgi:HSP20 family molecular chaperone IbpA
MFRRVPTMADDTAVMNRSGAPRDEQVQVRPRTWPFRPDGREDEPVTFPVDICETDDEFILVSEMPGVSKDAVSINVAENVLTIRASFQDELDQEEEVLFREIPGADYARSFTLSSAVDREKITADLKDGLLTVRLAKSESIKPRQIEIT